MWYHTYPTQTQAKLFYPFSPFTPFAGPKHEQSLLQIHPRHRQGCRRHPPVCADHGRRRQGNCPGGVPSLPAGGIPGRGAHPGGEGRRGGRGSGQGDAERDHPAQLPWTHQVCCVSRLQRNYHYYFHSHGHLLYHYFYGCQSHQIVSIFTAIIKISSSENAKTEISARMTMWMQLAKWPQQ